MYRPLGIEMTTRPSPKSPPSWPHKSQTLCNMTRPTRSWKSLRAGWRFPSVALLKCEPKAATLWRPSVRHRDFPCSRSAPAAAQSLLIFREIGKESRVAPEAPRPFHRLEGGMKSQNLHAIIIGGGIAGPALALLLKKAGMSSTVYEAHPRLEDVGGGFTIAPNGMNVLEEIGIADSVADSGAKVSEFCFRSQCGQILARYRAGNVEKYRWPSVATSRTTLHQILMEEVARQGIQLEYHKRLKELTTVDGGKVLALFEDGTTARGDFLVGADGVHSRVRQIIFPSAPGPSLG